MKHMIDDNGVIREMTKNEIEEMERMQSEFTAPTPDPLTEVNIKLDKILAILGGGKNG